MYLFKGFGVGVGLTVGLGVAVGLLVGVGFRVGVGVAVGFFVGDGLPVCVAVDALVVVPDPVGAVPESFRTDFIEHADTNRIRAITQTNPIRSAILRIFSSPEASGPTYNYYNA